MSAVPRSEPWTMRDSARGASQRIPRREHHWRNAPVARIPPFQLAADSVLFITKVRLVCPIVNAGDLHGQRFHPWRIAWYALFFCCLLISIVYRIAARQSVALPKTDTSGFANWPNHRPMRGRIAHQSRAWAVRMLFFFQLCRERPGDRRVKNDGSLKIDVNRLFVPGKRYNVIAQVGSPCVPRSHQP